MLYHVPGYRSLLAPVAALLLFLLQYLPAQVLWEVIGPRYRNVRGMDFIMTFENPATILGLPTTPNTGYPDPLYTDIASAAAMWMCYSGSTQMGLVDLQLARVKDVGFNTVRVWLSWQVYQHSPVTMVNRFQAFLTSCNGYHLYVIPVLWDNDFFDPDPTSIQGANDVNYHKWIRAPGQAAIQANNGHLNAQHRQFVVDMVNAATASPGVVLLWDAMNEPDIRSATRQDTWILETLAAIKATDANAKTCVTPPYWNHHVPEHVAVGSQDSLDVLAFNFYGYGQRDIEQLCNNVRLVCAAAGLSETKPILVSEAGRVGEGMYYPDALNLLEKVPAQYTGNPNPAEDGVGFCLFSANVGQKWEDPFSNPNLPLTYVNFPVVEMGDGLFYAPNYDDAQGNRRVRDYYPFGGQLVTRTLSDIAQIASNQGWSVTTPSNIVQMPFNDPDYIEQFPNKLPDGTARPVLDGILSAAASVGATSGLALADWKIVDRERSIALWIYTWSFQPDAAYYHGVPDLVPDQTMLDMYNDWASLGVMYVQNIGGNWATDPTFRATYQRLFGAVHFWWQAGGYDVRY